MSSKPKSLNRSRGMTLIEVLLAVLIFAGGMLGMSAFQSRILSISQLAYLNNYANLFAYDMLDRIKSNQIYGVEGPGYSVDPGDPPSEYPVKCVNGDCTPAELAAYDIDQWKFLVHEHLPGGDGSIAKSDEPEGRVYTISIFFDDSKGEKEKKQVTVRGIL